MANFDLRGSLTLDSARSQIARGGFGAVENCTWAAASDTLFDAGYGDHSPAALRALDNELEGLGAYAGGETWERNLRVIAFLAPDLAAVASIEYPADVAARIRELGAQGEEVHWAGWCTPNAVWTAGNLWGGISHAGRTVYADSGGIAVWNVWTGYLVYQPDAFWNAAYDGSGILVFKHPIGGADMSAETEAMLKRIHDSWFGIPLVTPPLPTDGRAANVGDLVVGISRVIGVDPADPTAATLTQHVAHAEQEAADLAAQLTAGLAGLTSGLEQLAAAVKAEADLAPALAALAGHVNSVQAGVEELLGHHTHGNVP